MQTSVELVRFSGQVHILSQVSKPTDPVGLHFNLMNVKGKGVTTQANYVATGAAQFSLPAYPSDPIQILFPFYPGDPMKPGTLLPGPPGGRNLGGVLLATISLDFSVDTGQLTGATGAFSTAPLP